MKLQSVAIAAALAVSSLGAAATTFDIGTMPIAPSVYSNVVTGLSAGALSDRYDFVFPALGATASGSAVTVDLLTFLNIDNVQVSLYDSSDTWLAAGPAGESSVLFDIPLIGGASFYYTVTGQVTGSVGGAYAFLASAAPVPEPETYAMMLAGLAAVGWLAARRRRAS